MQPSLSFEGLYVPLITPFTDDGELAPGALEHLAHAVLDDGANGLVALGTTAEAATIAPAERRVVLDTCARVCRSRGVTLIAGAGSNATRGTASALRDLAAWPEVSAALTVVPYYTRPSQDGIVAHFEHVATSSFAGLVAAWRAGKVAEGRELGRRLAPLAAALFAEPNPAVIKGVLHAQGRIPSPAVRLPLLPARAGTVAAAVNRLAEAGASC